MIFNKEIKNISGFDFVPGKRTEKKPDANLSNFYTFYFESSLIIAILLVTVIFILFPKVDIKPREIEAPVIVLEIEDIPPTTNPGRQAPKPPARPFIPVESDEAILVDEVIEDWDEINLFDLPGVPGLGGYGGKTGVGAMTKVNPRPILEVVPEYDEKEIDKGVKGLIELFIKINKKGKVTDVHVLKNTTNSKVLEKAVIEAAYKQIYTPAKLNGKPVEDELTRTYTFNLSNEK